MTTLESYHSTHRFYPSQHLGGNLRDYAVRVQNTWKCPLFWRTRCAALLSMLSSVTQDFFFIVSAKDHLQTALLIHGNTRFLHPQQLEQTRMQCSRTAGCGEAVSNLHNPQLDAASSGLSLSKPLWKMWEQIKLVYTAYIYICM